MAVFLPLSDPIVYAQNAVGAAAISEVPAAATPVPDADGTGGEGFRVLPLDVGPQMFFDARVNRFTSDGMKQVFEGDVVAIGGGVIIAADKVEFDRSRDTLEATGHVIILTESQLFTGDQLIYQVNNTNFKIYNSAMVNADQQLIHRLSQEVLGFTPYELWYETERRRRLDSLEQQKQRLRNRYRRDTLGGKELSEDLVDQYALTLEQEQIARDQENPALARMSPERRKNFKNRRQFWEKGRRDAAQYGSFSQEPSYFRLTGKVMQRTNGNDFEAYESVFSPCRCEDDEAPAWGFRADRIHAQVGGYADMYHPILEIKGIPILYLPYLKLPIKDRRQSGFLMPTFADDVRGSGKIYSQPVYLDLAPNFDSTITTEVFERRGTKLGLELRYQQRQYSGWEIQVETIRDRLWVADREARETLLPEYLADTSICDPNDPDPQNFLICQDSIRTRLGVPANTWRGSRRFRGVSLLAPRLSLAGRGEMNSDHRYVRDLRLPDNFQEALNTAASSNAFATSRARLHYDGKDLYASLGTGFGDQVLTDNQFAGHQLPMQAVAQSRMFTLHPGGRWTRPLYGQLLGEHRQITENYPEKNIDVTIPARTLGSGSWQRVKADFVSPLVTRGAVTIDHFTNLEARSIRHAALSEETSTIRSWRTGFTFNLPIDGQAQLPTFLNTTGDADDIDAGDRYLHHLMNWSITVAARPSVVRRGPYGDIAVAPLDDPNGARADLLYAATDRKTYVRDNDDIAPPSEWMYKQQTITFATTHRWRTFTRNWRLIPGADTAAGEENQKETFSQRARRELSQSLDRLVTSEAEIIDPKNPNRFLVNRYERHDFAYADPASFSANISYDLIKEKERRAAIKLANDLGVPPSNLPEPWSEPRVVASVGALGFGLTSDTRYNIYRKAAAESIFTLGLPSVYSSRLSFGYELKKEALDDNGSLTFNRTHTRRVGFNTWVIPRVRASVNLARRDTDVYESIMAMEYLSPSDCWGLKFVRTKEFGVDERLARYYLALTVIFNGQKKDYDGLEKAIVRQFPGDRDS